MNPDYKIWIVDEDLAWRETYKSLFDSNVSLSFFASGQDAASALTSTPNTPDLIISERVAARDCLASQRGVTGTTPKGREIPTIVVTNDTDLDALRESFKAGAASCHSKTEDTKVIRAVAENILARPTKNVSMLLGEFRIDNIYRRIIRDDGKMVTFTSKEFQILMAFHGAENAFLSRDDLLQRVWGKIKVGQKTLDVHLFNIRKKVAALDLRIKFEPPQNYRLYRGVAGVIPSGDEDL